MRHARSDAQFEHHACFGSKWSTNIFQYAEQGAADGHDDDMVVLLSRCEQPSRRHRGADPRRSAC
jgi:hypothetical protein